MTPPTAYSYARFSSAAQALGDSERRQIEDARKYANEKGYTLDETTIGVDRGKSGSSGENISQGVLGDFIRRAQAGKFAKGSILIVENPDRVSRQKFAIAYAAVYQPILQAGIEIHFLSIRDILRPDHSFMDLIRIGVEIDRSVSETVAKSQRLTSAWSEKKHKSQPGVAITGAMPAWLLGKKGEPIQVDEKRAETVRLMFEMAANGMGKRLITRRLNEQKVPTFSDDAPFWAHSTVSKILANRAVLGEYQPYKGRPGKKGHGTKINGESLKRVPDGEPRIGFFPRIVSDDLWQRAQDSMAQRRTKTADGKTTGKGAGQTGGLYNLFAGLVQDTTMGLPMHYSDKGKRDRPKLVTASKEVNGATPNFVVYAEFELAFLNWLDQLDWSTVIDAADTSDIKEAEKALATLNYSITNTEKQIESVLDLLIDTPSPALKERLGKLQMALAADKRSRIDAEKRLAEVKSKYRDLTNHSIIFAALSTTKDLQTRARLRQEIRRKVSRIEIHFGKVARSFMGVAALAKVYFVNGVERWLAFSSGVACQIFPQEADADNFFRLMHAND